MDTTACCCGSDPMDGDRFYSIPRVGSPQAGPNRPQTVRAPCRVHLLNAACACCASNSNARQHTVRPIPCIALFAIASLDHRSEREEAKRRQRSHRLRRLQKTGMQRHPKKPAQGAKFWSRPACDGIHSDGVVIEKGLGPAEIDRFVGNAWCVPAPRVDRWSPTFRSQKHVPRRCRLGLGIEIRDVGVRTARLTHPRYTPHSHRDRRRPVRGITGALAAEAD